MGRRAVKVTYKPFAWEEQTFFSPYILKEFRNRWFIFGKRHDSPDRLVLNLALDRIMVVADAPKEEKYLREKAFDPNSYFKNMIGVTREMDSPIEHIVFEASAYAAPYIRTKPLHDSQRVVECKPDGRVVFSIDVIVNYELDRVVLGLGEWVTVISPASFSEKIQQILTNTLNSYPPKK